ncbi:MAG: hypothetical protein ACJ73S_27910 [Mycobacteriales bacterium]
MYVEERSERGPVEAEVNKIPESQIFVLYQKLKNYFEGSVLTDPAGLRRRRSPVAETVTAAVATREGVEPPNADAAYVYEAADGTVTAALIDGIGHSARVAERAGLLAGAAALTAATRGGLAGMLAAGQLVADPGLYGDEPDAVGIVAVVGPASGVVVNWVGDCRAYGWDAPTCGGTRPTTLSASSCARTARPWSSRPGTTSGSRRRSAARSPPLCTRWRSLTRR